MASFGPENSRLSSALNLFQISLYMEPSLASYKEKLHSLNTWNLSYKTIIQTIRQ